MKRFISTTVLAGVASVLLLGATNAMAQRQGGRGNFDPEAMRQQMMENIKTRLEINNDDEWKAIEPRVQKVMDARRAVGGGGGFGAFGFGRGGGRGGQGGQAADAGNADGGGRRRGGGGAGGGGGGGFGQPSPEQEALQQALESKASAEDVKAKLAKLREARKQKQAELEKAQEELKKVLTARQEATAVLLNLLN